MKVSIRVLLFTFMVPLNSIEPTHRLVFDLVGQAHRVDARNTLIGYPNDSRFGQVFYDGKGNLFAANRNNKLVRGGLDYYVLYDRRGRYYNILVDTNQPISPLGSIRDGFVLVDLQGCHYSVNGQNVVIPYYGPAGPVPPPPYPIESDTIQRNSRKFGVIKNGGICPYYGGSEQMCEYIPDEGDIVRRWQNPFSQFHNQAWHYLIY